MSSPAFEGFLVRVLLDRGAREQFLSAPESVARAAGLNDHEVAALAGIDRAGLLLAAESLRRKAEAERGATSNRRRPWWRRMPGPLVRLVSMMWLRSANSPTQFGRVKRLTVENWGLPRRRCRSTIDE